MKFRQEPEDRSIMHDGKKRFRRSGGMILKLFLFSFFLAPSLLLGIKACFAV